MRRLPPLSYPRQGRLSSGDLAQSLANNSSQVATASVQYGGDLVLYDATRRRAYWLPVQRYFREDVARQPKKGAKTVRVRVPRRQVVNRRAIATLRLIKEGNPG